MAILLDTHILLWAASGDARLPPKARKLLTGEDDVFFSVVNLWEVVIKNAKSSTPVDGERLRTRALAGGLSELPVRGHHALEVGRLPHLHRDPFDRMLLAQAVSEGMRLLTVDSRLLSYGEPAESA